jgi:DNA invertase Pin-like site-specific DNA recombinase
MPSRARRTHTPPRLIAYTRVSTDEQAEHGHGLDAQEIRVRAAAEYADWTLLELVRDEAVSGKDLHRPALAAALRKIAAGKADGLVVAKLDRLTRSVVDFGRLLEWFKDADATLVALDFALDTSTPTGKFVANVMVSVAEWERETIGARTKEGLAALRAKGLPAGRPAVADEPELAARIIGMQAAGLSLQAIADQLNAEGVPTARGGAVWRKSSLQTITGGRRRAPRRRVAELPELRARRA